MNKKIFLVIITLALSSCVDTEELYFGNAYATDDFASNCYRKWDDGLKEASLMETAALAKGTGYYSGSGNDLYPGGNNGADALKSSHPESFLHEGRELQWVYEGFTDDGYYVDGDILNYGKGVYADQSPLYGFIYGQTKKLTLINDGFSKGYLSKLYNGQIRCDGWSSYSLVELDQTGYGTLFPAELSKASYFAFSARGGSNTPYGSQSYGVKDWGATKAYGSGRITTFDITITFYKYSQTGLVGYPFKLEGVNLETNTSAEHTSLIAFYFDEVGYDPSGTIGMSMTYDLVSDDARWKIGEEEEAVAKTTGDFLNAKEDEYLTSLILLEVLFPDSSWN